MKILTKKILKGKTAKKNLFLALLMMALLAVSLGGIGGSASLLSYAEDAEELDEESDEYLCAIAVVSKGEELIADYTEFLDEYFKQNVPGSEQVEHAMNFYRYVEDVLHNTYTENLDLRGNLSFDTVSSETSLCAYRRDQYIEYAGVLLQAYSRYSANSKRTFMLVDGLKAINADMEDFSRDFHEIFPGLLNQMDSALPCFARGCISK